MSDVIGIDGNAEPEPAAVHSLSLIHAFLSSECDPMNFANLWVKAKDA